MTSGLTRRNGAQDSLAGHKDMQPVTIQGPGVQNPRGIRTPDTSYQSRIANQLSQWSAGKLAEAVGKQQQKSILDGQMAYQQGKAREDLEMAGDKWALEGYALMDAQTISSSLLAAQREQIAQVGYTLSEDEFRTQFTNRLDAMLEGKDPRTADLVREQMANQMPTLVADHTAAHYRHLEDQSYQSLERSIDVVSRDPTATEQLVDFARGDAGSPSSGLSPERRQAATVSGVVRAFDNDNPLAYSALAKEGLLGDNLTSAEQNAIRAAQKRFEQRRRSEYDQELFNGEQALMRKVERGEIEPSKAVEELSVLYADHDINMTAAEAGSIYNNALNTSRQADVTRGMLIEEAGLRGDLDTQANIIMDSLIGTESGGKADAFRTNIDGRSFAGLVQMGAARLTDYALSTGNRQLTPAQYAALPASEQKAIARWHFKDLIQEAQATGAIGSKINGVTVTLSGLVAVAHLGGAGGMRRFVETNGQYNPADELGTTLTKYLDVHGSGEREEHMSANRRLQLASNRLDQTRERLAIETYEQVAPVLADLDDQFRRGELTERAWKYAREMTYDTYGQARSRADVNHEINTVRAVDAEVAAEATRTTNTQYKLDLEAAQAKLVAPRLAWEEVMENPASTPEAIREATDAYVTTRSSVFSEHGIAPIDQSRGKVSEEIITTTKEAMDRHVKWQGEQAEIDAAVANGYLGRLPKNLQSRAFEQFEKETVEMYQNAVSSKQIDPEAANASIARDFNTFFAQAGVVDPKVAMRMSAAVLGQLVDSEGNPNPNVVDAISQYAQVKALNPSAAETMLDPEALVRAEAALSRADDPSLLGEAVRNLGMELSNSPLIQNSDEYMSRTDVQSSIDREVSNYLETRDIGILHAIWQNDATLDQYFDTGTSASDRLVSQETRDMIHNEVAVETARLQRISPNIKPRDLVAKAAERVSARTEMIGGDVVTIPSGQSFGEKFFGGRAQDFMHDGAINSAVMEWLRSDEAQNQYDFISGTVWAEHLDHRIQGAIGAVVDALPGDMQFDPAISNEDALSTLTTGVRPFRSFPAPSGDVAVQILMPNGSYSEAIVVPSARAGEMYMEKRRQEMTQ